LPNGSDLDMEFNYVRNSVKATVDAYDGTVTLYVVNQRDEPDPLIRAYQKAFPGLFTSENEMPRGCANTGATRRTCSAPRPSTTPRTT
jgi:uncharacterized membrane protein (UPF0182 family)